MKPHSTTGLATVVALLAGIAALPPATKAADQPVSVAKLLAKAKAQANLISVDAAILQSYTHSNFDWRTHATQITRIKEDINAAAKTVTALIDAKSHAAPWQVAAIDRILPYLREMADDTTSAIEYINANQSRLFMQEYKDYLQANADISHEMASLVAQYVDYGNHKGDYEKLRKKLELPEEK